MYILWLSLIRVSETFAFAAYIVALPHSLSIPSIKISESRYLLLSSICSAHSVLKIKASNVKYIKKK